MANESLFTVKGYHGQDVQIFEIDKAENRIRYQIINVGHKKPVWLDRQSFFKYISPSLNKT